MQTIRIPLSEDVYRTLDRLARENGTDPATLIRVQVKRLAAMYRGEGLTPNLREHLAVSIDKHRKLLPLWQNVTVERTGPSRGEAWKRL